MVLPRALARFNRVVTNRIGRLVAPQVRNAGILVHRGRRSGREYRTPLAVLRRPGGYAIPLTYGPEAEWVQNVLQAGGATLETGGQHVQVTNPRVVHDPARRMVPPLVRAVLRSIGADAFLLLDLQASGEPY
ncbi:MAG: nitroreductase family deazaflavin-dependent oxidoreductase [Chloroflexota bacterium]